MKLFPGHAKSLGLCSEANADPRLNGGTHSSGTKNLRHEKEEDDESHRNRHRTGPFEGFEAVGLRELGLRRVPFSTSGNEIEAVFEIYGPIISTDPIGSAFSADGTAKVTFKHARDAARAFDALNGRKIFKSSGVPVALDLLNKPHVGYTDTRAKPKATPHVDGSPVNGFSEYFTPKRNYQPSEEQASKYTHISPGDQKALYIVTDSTQSWPNGRPPTGPSRSEDISPPPLRRYDTYRPSLQHESRQALHYDSYRPDDRRGRGQKSVDHVRRTAYPRYISRRDSDASRPADPARVHSNQESPTRYRRESAPVQGAHVVSRNSLQWRRDTESHQDAPSSKLVVSEQAVESSTEEEVRQIRPSSSPYLPPNGPDDRILMEESAEEGEYSPQLLHSPVGLGPTTVLDRKPQSRRLLQDTGIEPLFELALPDAALVDGAGTGDMTMPISTGNELLKRHPGLSDETSSLRSEVTTSDRTGTSTNSLSRKKRHCKECRRAAHLFPLQKCTGCQRRVCDFCRVVYLLNDAKKVVRCKSCITKGSHVHDQSSTLGSTCLSLDLDAKATSPTQSSLVLNTETSLATAIHSAAVSAPKAKICVTAEPYDPTPTNGTAAESGGQSTRKTNDGNPRKISLSGYTNTRSTGLAKTIHKPDMMYTDHIEKHVDHSVRLPNKRYTCKFWKKGYCRYDEVLCDFAHTETGLDASSLKEKTITCYYWRKGGCRFNADDCTYAHRDTGCYAPEPPLKNVETPFRRSPDLYTPTHYDQYRPSRQKTPEKNKLAGHRTDYPTWYSPPAPSDGITQSATCNRSSIEVEVENGMFDRGISQKHLICDESRAGNIHYRSPSVANPPPGNEVLPEINRVSITPATPSAEALPDVLANSNTEKERTTDPGQKQNHVASVERASPAKHISTVPNAPVQVYKAKRSNIVLDPRKRLKTATTSMHGPERRTSDTEEVEVPCIVTTVTEPVKPQKIATHPEGGGLRAKSTRHCEICSKLLFGSSAVCKACSEAMPTQNSASDSRLLEQPHQGRNPISSPSPVDDLDISELFGDGSNSDSDIDATGNNHGNTELEPLSNRKPIEPNKVLKRKTTDEVLFLRDKKRKLSFFGPPLRSEPEKTLPTPISPMSTSTTIAYIQPSKSIAAPTHRERPLTLAETIEKERLEKEMQQMQHELPKERQCQTLGGSVQPLQIEEVLAEPHETQERPQSLPSESASTKPPKPSPRPEKAGKTIIRKEGLHDFKSDRFDPLQQHQTATPVTRSDSQLDDGVANQSRPHLLQTQRIVSLPTSPISKDASGEVRKHGERDFIRQSSHLACEHDRQRHRRCLHNVDGHLDPELCKAFLRDYGGRSDTKRNLQEMAEIRVVAGKGQVIESQDDPIEEDDGGDESDIFHSADEDSSPATPSDEGSDNLPLLDQFLRRAAVGRDASMDRTSPVKATIQRKVGQTRQLPTKQERGIIAELTRKGVHFESSSDSDSWSETQTPKKASFKARDPLYRPPRISHSLLEAAPEYNQAPQLDYSPRKKGTLPTRTGWKQQWKCLLADQCERRRREFGDPHWEVERAPKTRLMESLEEAQAIPFDLQDQISKDRLDVQMTDSRTVELTIEDFLGIPEKPVACLVGEKIRGLAWRDGSKDLQIAEQLKVRGARIKRIRVPEEEKWPVSSSK